MKKIVDGFTFFNELDLLEIRLKYLYDVVDYFIIVESDTSFNGEAKQMFFKENSDRFSSFIDKIIYVPINMKYFEDGKNVAWKREEFQRNSILNGITGLNICDTDYILISDVDEIPNIEVLKKIKSNFLEIDEVSKMSNLKLIFKTILNFFKFFLYIVINKDIGKLWDQFKLIYLTKVKNLMLPLNFKMFNYYYYLNYQKKGSKWDGSQCVQYKLLNYFTPNEIRNFRNSSLYTLNDSGWHFSYLGGKEMIKHKIKNFSHQEFNIPQIVSDEYIDFCIKNGYSLFDYYKNPKVKPKYVKKELSHLPEKLLKIIVDYKKLILD